MKTFLIIFILSFFLQTLIGQASESPFRVRDTIEYLDHPTYGYQGITTGVKLVRAKYNQSLIIPKDKKVKLLLKNRESVQGFVSGHIQNRIIVERNGETREVLITEILEIQIFTLKGKKNIDLPSLEALGLTMAFTGLAITAIGIGQAFSTYDNGGIMTLVGIGTAFSGFTIKRIATYKKIKKYNLKKGWEIHLLNPDSAHHHN